MQEDKKAYEDLKKKFDFEELIDGFNLAMNELVNALVRLNGKEMAAQALGGSAYIIHEEYDDFTQTEKKIAETMLIGAAIKVKDPNALDIDAGDRILSGYVDKEMVMHVEIEKGNADPV